MSAQPARRLSHAEVVVNLTRRGPLHVILIVIGIIWLAPTVGLAVTSFRSRADISASGWWTVASGDRTTSTRRMTITVSDDSGDEPNAIQPGETATADLLVEATEGIPAANVRFARVLGIYGSLRVDALESPIDLPGVGSVTFGADGNYDFRPRAGYDGAFVADVPGGETPFTVAYELVGYEAISGELEIEALGESVRVPRAGKLIVHADGSYDFEPRASFVGAFNPSIDRARLDSPPFSVPYAMLRAGGPLTTVEAGTRLDVPLAGWLLAETEGSFSFTAAQDFEGSVEVEFGFVSPLLTLENYDEVFNRPQLQEPGFLTFFKNSFIITLPSTILPIVIAALAAYAFAWLDLPFRNALYLTTIAMLIVPLQTTWIPVLRMLNLADLIGTWPGIWISHSAYGTPFAIFLLYNFFKDLPGELFEAARVDGATEFGIFVRVVLPLSVPALASLGIFQFVWVWNDLMNALIFLADQSMFPLTVGVRQLVGQYANEWDILASGAFITMVVPLIVFFSLQRYFVRGVTAGAVKG